MEGTAQGSGSEQTLEPETLGLILSLALPSCVTLNKCLNLSVPQSPRLQKGSK